MSEPKWHVGQKVIVRPSMNDRARDREPREEEITRVGRKFFYVPSRYGGGETKYSIEDGVEETNYPGDAHRAVTPEMQARIIRQEKANRRLQDMGLSYQAGGRMPYSVEKLEAIVKILEASDE